MVVIFFQSLKQKSSPKESRTQSPNQAAYTGQLELSIMIVTKNDFLTNIQTLKYKDAPCYWIW